MCDVPRSFLLAKAEDLLGDVIAYSATINACKKGAAWEEALELLSAMMLS